MISQLAAAAVALAAGVDDVGGSGAETSSRHRQALRHDVERQAMSRPEWAITTRVDTRAHWETVWRAVQCHRTQIAIYQGLAEPDSESHEALWGNQTFYRVSSTANVGGGLETDLFEGLR